MCPKRPNKLFFSFALSRQVEDAFFNFEASSLAEALKTLSKIQKALKSLHVVLADGDDEDIFKGYPPDAPTRKIFVKISCPDCLEWRWEELGHFEAAPCWMECDHCETLFHVFSPDDLKTFFQTKVGCTKCKHKVDCLVIPPM